MHYTVKFTGTRRQKEEQALKETISYLGPRSLRKLVDNISSYILAGGCVSRAMEYRAIRFFCAANGVQGYYPVRAVARKVFAQINA